MAFQPGKSAAKKKPVTAVYTCNGFLFRFWLESGIELMETSVFLQGRKTKHR